ncbi:DUF4158 domain-containing protein [Parasphingorhabdus pacifica]
MEFLTDEQAAGFGRFTECPSQAELERVFLLDDADRAEVAKRRGAARPSGIWSRCVPRSSRWSSPDSSMPKHATGNSSTGGDRAAFRGVRSG